MKKLVSLNYFENAEETPWLVLNEGNRGSAPAKAVHAKGAIIKFPEKTKNTAGQLIAVCDSATVDREIRLPDLKFRPAIFGRDGLYCKTTNSRIVSCDHILFSTSGDILVADNPLTNPAGAAFAASA